MTEQERAPAWTVKYDNDVGPDDGGFWEWWDVYLDDAHVARFDNEADAIAYAAMMNARPAIPEDVREGVAKIIEEQVTYTEVKDTDTFFRDVSVVTSDAVLSYLTSIG